MTEKTNGDITTVVPSNTQLSYVLSITVPQPTFSIRIRIPRMLARAMQRRTHDDCESAENGSSKKYRDSRKNATKKISSIFSVFRSKRSKSLSLEIADCSDAENGEVEKTGDDLPEMIVATGFGVSRLTGLKGGEGKEQKRKGRVTKSVSFEIDDKLKTCASGDEVVSNTDEPAGRKRQVPRSVRTRSRNTSVEALEIINKHDFAKVGSKPETKPQDMPKKVDIPKVALKPGIHRKLKVPQSVKRILGLEEKQELCKKRILMGDKCRPLGSIKYDEDGIMLPGPIP